MSLSWHALTDASTLTCTCPPGRTLTQLAHNQAAPAAMLIGSQRVSHRSAPAFVEGVEIKKKKILKTGDFCRGHRCNGAKRGIMGSLGWMSARAQRHATSLAPDSPFTDTLSESEVPNVQPVGIAGRHWEELDCLTPPDRRREGGGGNKERDEREREGEDVREKVQRGQCSEGDEHCEIH